MNDIDVVVVDDNEFDRYIVKRKLAKVAGFGDVSEAVAGDRFLDSVEKGESLCDRAPPPQLVLMDINMPRLNGFETVERLQDIVHAGRGAASIVVMMFTSSNNPSDRQRAKSIPMIKGYICKPLDEDGIERILTIYSEHGTIAANSTRMIGGQQAAH